MFLSVVNMPIFFLKLFVLISKLHNNTVILILATIVKFDSKYNEEIFDMFLIFF